MTGLYNFPFIPYDIQSQLMDSLYEVFDNKKIGIFESPTGTGKSLSIICAAIKWIQDFETNQLKSLTEELKKVNKQIERLESESNVSSDWIQIQNNKSMICQQKEQIIKRLNRFEIKSQRTQELIKRKKNSIIRKKFSLNHKNVCKKLKNDSNCDIDSNSSDNELDEELVDYCSDEEVVEQKNELEDNERFVKPKIYYCSRTHSQLSQFINEIKKTLYSRQERPLRMVPLGSRNIHCINESVLKLNNNNLKK